MSDESSPDWMTYTELAEQLNMSLQAVAQLARRRKWAMRFRDQTKIQEFEVPAGAPGKPGSAKKRTPGEGGVAKARAKAGAAATAEAPARPELGNEALQTALDAARSEIAAAEAARREADAKREMAEVGNADMATALDAARSEIAAMEAARLEFDAKRQMVEAVPSAGCS